MVTYQTAVHPQSTVVAIIGVALSIESLLGRIDASVSAPGHRSAKLLKLLRQRLISGQLTSDEVEAAALTPDGESLAKIEEGNAILALVYAVCLLRQGQWDEAIEAATPAEEDEFTNYYALVIKASAHESKGNISSADACLNTAAQKYGVGAGLIYAAAMMIDIAKGIRALAERSAKKLEANADRVIALDRMGERAGIPGSAESAFQMFKAWLAGDLFTDPPYLQPPHLPSKAKALLNKRIDAEAAQFQQETHGQAVKHLEEFEETVRLLAIEDPFERWAELSRLIGKDWPKGLTAVQAIRDERGE